MKKVLVIGGSYFLGRVFTMISNERYELTLLNRGRYSMADYGVREIRCDRRDREALSEISFDEKYDAVVDFCAYEKGDIEILFGIPGLDFDKYIYISTADVFAPSEKIRDDSFPLRNDPGCDEGSQYAYKKKILEDELSDNAVKAGADHLILRPAFIYGPYNYAPREYSYIEKIVKGEEILIPENADGHFQIVYVKDVAETVCIAIDNDLKKNAYLIAAPKVYDYELFAETLVSSSGTECSIRKTSFRELSEKRVILPYPLSAAENELFDGSAFADETGFEYSDPGSTLANTYKAFEKVFKN